MSKTILGDTKIFEGGTECLHRGYELDVHAHIPALIITCAYFDFQCTGFPKF